MATRAEIEKSLSAVVDVVRRGYLKDLADYTKRPIIVYASAFGLGKWAGIPGNIFSVNNEDIQGFMAALCDVKGAEIDILLHSPGGSLDAAEQIVNYLRAKFTNIRVFVPQSAMSAATMICCAADVIVMGKQSALGPTDPQFSLGKQGGLPAHSILAEFAQAKTEIAQDPRSAAIWVPRLQSLPPGFLSLCQQTIALSKEKVTLWLTQYMKLDPVAAKEAADWFGDAQEHKTHGRPINAKLAREKGLKVVDLEDDQLLQDKVLSVYHAIMATFERTSCVKITENHLGKGFYLQASKGP